MSLRWHLSWLTAAYHAVFQLYQVRFSADRVYCVKFDRTGQRIFTVRFSIPSSIA